jgi:hypothetical protein
MRNNSLAVLGLFVTDSTIEGVLLNEDKDGKIHFVQRVSKRRLRPGETVLNGAAILPGMKDHNESDYTLEIGDGSSRGAEMSMQKKTGSAGGGTAVA